MLILCFIYLVKYEKRFFGKLKYMVILGQVYQAEHRRLVCCDSFRRLHICMLVGKDEK